MNSLGSYRLASRLARREVVRRPWRTLLVATLIAVPVAGMVMAAAFLRTDHLSVAQNWELSHGAADVVVTVDDPAADPAARERFLAALPAGSRVATYASSFANVRTGTGERSAVDVLSIDLSDPIVGDAFTVFEGRRPTQANEVFLTRQAAKELHTGVGQTVHLTRPATVDWLVVGVGERRAWWGGATVVAGSGTVVPEAPSGPAQPRSLTTAVDLPPGTTAAQVQALVRSNTSVESHPRYWEDRLAESSPSEGVAWTWVIGAVVLMVVGIVIASAFAAGARRQLATLGQLAANGARPVDLGRVLSLQGTWTGLVGTAAGVLLGAAGLMALAPRADRLFGRDTDPWVVRATDLVPIVLLGVATATIAALVPARTTKRIPVLSALAGRRPLGRVPRHLSVAGGMASLCGLGLLGLAALGGSSASDNAQVWALTAVIGGMAVLLGACAVTPAYTSFLEPLAARWRGPWRLAARSLARQRTRTSAVVAGVCASGALAIAASALVLGAAADANSSAWMRADEVQIRGVPQFESNGETVQVQAAPPAAPPETIVASVRRALGSSQAFPLTVARPAEADAVWVGAGPVTSGDGGSFDFFDGAVVWDDAAAGAYDLRPVHRRALERSGALLLGETAGIREVLVRNAADAGPAARKELVVNGRSNVALSGQGVATADRPTGVDATVVNATAYSLGSLPRLLLTPATAARLAVSQQAGPVVLRANGPLTREQRLAVTDVAQEYWFDNPNAGNGAASPPQIQVDQYEPATRLDPLLLEAALTTVSLLFTLLVVATSLALASAETRDERDVLSIVGARPTTLRRTNANKAAVLAVLGAVLALPVGFLPVAVFGQANSPSLPLVFPWRTALLLVAAVPAIAWLATLAASAIALRLRPVHISTMAFE